MCFFILRTFYFLLLFPKEIKNVLLEEALNERADEEMEFSDLESDSSGQSNKENGEPPRAKKMRLSGEDAKTVHQLKVWRMCTHLHKRKKLYDEKDDDD